MHIKLKFTSKELKNMKTHTDEINKEMNKQQSNWILLFLISGGFE